MTKRREFLKNSSLLTTALFFGDQLKSVAELSKNNSFLKEQLQTVTILHTNDLQGIISPFFFGEKAGLGGLNNVNDVIEKQDKNHLLFDAGDFLNEDLSFAHNKQMILQMNKTGYHAVTIGDKDLWNGEDYLASLFPFMNFKLINCNYEFSNPVLKNGVKSYQVIKHGGYKIGVTGIGIDDTNNPGLKEITYHHPYQKANQIAAELKNMNCDLVVCLSHLGCKKENEELNNIRFAAESKNIDLIISGHDDTIMNTQFVLQNKQKDQVIVSHAGWGGLMMGKLSFSFDEMRNQNFYRSKSYIPGLPANQSVFEKYKKLIA